MVGNELTVETTYYTLELLQSGTNSLLDGNVRVMDLNTHNYYKYKLLTKVKNNVKLRDRVVGVV